MKLPTTYKFNTYEALESFVKRVDRMIVERGYITCRQMLWYENRKPVADQIKSLRRGLFDYGYSYQPKVSFQKTMNGPDTWEIVYPKPEFIRKFILKEKHDNEI